jgi:hypothetical protein
MHHFIFGFIFYLGFKSLTLMATAATARLAVLAALTALLMTTRTAAFLRGEREHFDGCMFILYGKKKKLY